MEEILQNPDFVLMAMAVAFKFCVALLAFAGVRIAIYNFDRAFGISCPGWLNDSSDMAKALYFGLRLVAVCILFGYIFS